MRKFKSLVTEASFDDKILELALEVEFRDVEDGVQYYTAIENSCKAIITRNKRNLKIQKYPF